MILLDTHVLVWLESRVRISNLAAAAITAARRSQRIHVSPLSAYEIGWLVRRGRISLGKVVETWFEDVMNLPGMRRADFTDEIAIRAASLPAPLHGDPIDRLLIATAQVPGLTLLTRDRQVLNFASGGHLDVIAA